jgi:hypothetical protein
MSINILFLKKSNKTRFFEKLGRFALEGRGEVNNDLTTAAYLIFWFSDF